MERSDDARPLSVAVPSELQDHVAGYHLSRAALGEAARTYRLTGERRPARYLKIGRDLERERARLCWAAAYLPVPRVVAFATDDARDYLLLDALPGTPLALAEELPIRERVVHLARTLRELHALPVARCPFDARIEARLAEAEASVAQGLVDEADFDDERRGRTAASVLAELRAWPPFSEELVVTHGDYTLDNVLVQPTGLVDLGRLGVGDRHQDLALALRDLEGEHGHRWRDLFVAEYGRSAIDEARLAFFRLLDELL